MLTVRIVKLGKVLPRKNFKCYFIALIFCKFDVNLFFILSDILLKRFKNVVVNPIFYFYQKMIRDD
jgi:hypothetical protein